MSELRAPDPTLTALPPEDSVYVSILDRAHLTRDCRGADGIGVMISAYHARWFAVPCRSCFPDAPPPGWQTCGHDVCGPRCKGHGGPDFALSWQTGGDA